MGPLVAIAPVGLRVSTAAVLALGVLSSGQLWAQTTGSISGVVTNASTSAPLAGANVVLHNAQGRPLANQSVDASGGYSFVNLSFGRYFLTFARPGFVTELNDGDPCMGAECVVVAATPVVLTSGAPAGTANAALAPEARISGTVRRADGSPIGTAEVAIYTFSGVPIVSGSVNSDGTFNFGGLIGSSYYVRAQAGPTQERDYLEELYGGNVCPSIDRQPTCRVTIGTQVSLTAGATTSGIDFSLDPGGRISGIVSGPAGPLQGIIVSALTGGVTFASATTDAAGQYTIAGLPTAAYHVRTSSPVTVNVVDVWRGGPCVGCAGSRAVVQVTAGATTSGIDFSLATGGKIAGTLRFVVQPSAVFGPSIEVFSQDGTLVRTKPSFVVSPGVTGAASTTASVPYEIAGLATGRYYVRTSNPASPPGRPGPPAGGFFIDEVFDNIVCVAADCTPARGTPVTVTAGAVTSNVDFTLDSGGSITGTIPSDSFTPVMHLYDSRGIELPSRVYVLNDFPFPGSPISYAAVGLPAGNYYLKLDRSRTGTHAGVLYKDVPCDACPVTSGTPIVVTRGQQTTQIDFPSIAGFGIGGHVFRPGAVIGGMPIEVRAVDGFVVARTVVGNRYAVTGLAGGTYRVRALNFIGPGAGNGSAAETETLVTIPGTGGGDPTEVTLTMPDGFPVIGTIRDGSGAAVPQASASFYPLPSGLPAVTRAFSNAFGGYEIALASGTSHKASTDPLQGYTRELFEHVPCAHAVCDLNDGTTFTPGPGTFFPIDFTLNACTAPVIAPLELARAAVNIAYRQTLLAAGVSGARFAIASGALPPGLTLDSATGVISGTPTEPGAYSFTISAASTSGCIGTREYTLDVPACAFTLTPTEFFTRARGEPFLITITNGCGTVTATTKEPWISIDTVTPTAIVGKTRPYTGTQSRTGRIIVGPRVFTVHQNGVAATPPFGAVDSPADGATVSGSIAVSGWALDDMLVHRVLIFRDRVAGEPAGGQVFIGTATFVPGARPDVQAAFPSIPSGERAGWGYLLLTNQLPNQGNGTFRLYAYAEDSDLRRTLLGVRAINAVNANATAPFGAIDTPAQGEKISGAGFVNWGWALTPQPKLIPFDGSTIRVFIDGAPLGTLNAYNLFRPDVSGLFPGLKNSGGPVGYRVFDTTALSEGLHTISWGVVDDAGRAAGIGSRYFTVQNSAWQPSLRVSSTLSATFEPMARAAAPAVSSLELQAADANTPVPATVPGIDLGRRSASIQALPLAEEGTQRLVVRELQRVEIRLQALGSRLQEGTCAATYEGYSVAGDELRTLPVGASLDAAGQFYWQPGAGFFGAYQLLFVKTTCDGTRTRIPMTVTIGAR